MTASFGDTGLDSGLSVSHARPAPSTDWAHSEATRYLCVGAYLDPAFRHQVLRNVLRSRHRAVAPSYGVDIVPVIRHCLRAQRREFLQNVALVALLLVTALISLWTLVYALCFGLGWSVFFGIVRTLRGGRDRTALVTVAGLIVVAVVVGAFSVLSAFLSAFDEFQGSDFGGSVESSGSSGATLFFFVFFLFWAVAWGIRFTGLVVNQNTILQELSPGRFDPAAAPPEPPRYAERVAYLAEAQTGNVTYYASEAARRPFVGSGQAGAPMALTVPLVRRGEAPAEPLTVQALYRRMRLALVTLADPETPATERVHGLSMQSRVFVPGLLRPDDGLLDPRTRLPRHHLSRAELDRMVQYDRNRPTEYLAVRIAAWEGELEITLFVYFSIRGQTLYTEFVASVLPSIRENYHHVDRAQQLDPVTYARMVRISFRNLPVLSLRAPLEVFRTGKASLLELLTGRSEVQEMRNQLAFDYGIRASVRELGADFEAENFFQYADTLRYVYLVESRLRDAVGEVLEDFGFANQEFLDKAAVIIDNSTRITGGNFTVGAMSVGANSQAQNWAPSRAMTPPADPRPTENPPPGPANPSSGRSS